MSNAIRLVQGENDPRPEIKVKPEDLDRMVREAVAALATDPEVYQRGGVLVHVVSNTSHATRVETPTIRALPMAVLRVRLAACARWMRYDTKAEAWKRTGVPDAVVAGVHSLGAWSGVRTLIGVITSPTIRPDGTILQAAGYDESTSLLHWPSADFVGVVDDCGLTHAKEAAGTILDLVCDFPFATDSDRSAWLAGVLSLVGRAAIDGPCPMFVLDATTPGTGKSRLVDLAVRIACGHDAPRTSLSTADEEQRKQITSLLLVGDPAILVDNVDRKLGGQSLDAVLTSVTWKERDLGKTSILQLPARAIWFATGNNVQFRGDLTRRSLRIRLESDDERPEERTGFKYPHLLDHALVQRRVLVACALTILRAHANAGRPLDGPVWGSFESWSKIIAGAIRWMGHADPMASAATASDEHDEVRMWGAATIAGLVELQRQRADEPVMTRDILDALYPNGDAARIPGALAAMREAVESATASTGSPGPLRLAKWLRRLVGRVIGEQRVVSRLDTHAKSQAWIIERVPPKTDAARGEVSE